MRYLLIVAVALPGLARAQAVRVEDDGIPRVVASATKTARVAPDRVSFYAVVEGAAESGAEAAQRVERKLQTVTDAVKQAGGRAEVTAAMPYGVMPAPNYGGYPGQPSQNPFVARYVLRV